MGEKLEYLGRSSASVEEKFDMPILPYGERWHITLDYDYYMRVSILDVGGNELTSETSDQGHGQLTAIRLARKIISRRESARVLKETLGVEVTVR